MDAMVTAIDLPVLLNRCAKNKSEDTKEIVQKMFIYHKCLACLSQYLG